MDTWLTKKGRKKAAFVAALLMAVSFAGCGPQGEEDSPVVLAPEQDEITYEMAVAVLGDVEQRESMKCTYKELSSEDISFAMSGRQIAEVYVAEGDHVKKGQLLAELTGGNLDKNIKDLEYRIARNKLLLDNIVINEDYEISTLWLNYLYQSGQSEWEKEALEANVERVQQNYRYTREDCEDALALDEAELEKLQRELKQSRVYAGMDGTVSWVKDDLKGSTSAMDERIMTIIDSSACVFVTEKEAFIPYFKEGEAVELSIIAGTGAGKYTVIPFMMDKWGEQQMFVLTADNENSIIGVGATGTLTVTLERREQVLTIPVNAVHEADGKPYVYVLGENNMRTIKWIETGLYGKTNVEVTSGLERGERVIVK